MSDPFTVSDVFLNARGPLVPKDSAAAIIVNPSGGLLLQLRDDRADIFFPNHWGCFGGAIDAGETYEENLQRELFEELHFTVDVALIRLITTITFRPKPDSADTILRHYYAVPVAADAMANMRLGEGSDFRFFTPDEAMRLANATPYDKFALWLYLNHQRL
jgi:8-oxo-dGTP pyrophosphatase MutT (NUDIX family)